MIARKCENCECGQMEGRAVSRYLGHWLCVQCAVQRHGQKKNPHAVALGKRGGSARSDAKAEAARKNGQKGGRPPTGTPGGGTPGPAQPGTLRNKSAHATKAAKGQKLTLVRRKSA